MMLEKGRGFLAKGGRAVYSRARRRRRLAVWVWALLLTAGLAGCGASEEVFTADRVPAETPAPHASEMAGPAGLAGPLGPPSAEGPHASAMAGSDGFLTMEKAIEVPAEAMAAEAYEGAAPDAAEAPAITTMAAAESTPMPMPMSTPAPGAPEFNAGARAEPADEGLLPFRQIQASAAAQERVIIRTVQMSLVADEIADTVARIGEIAQAAGGWLVSSDRSSRHYGQVSIRVPAQNLDNAVGRIRGLAVAVESESSTSQDVTDEYVDHNSRLRSLRATEGSLLALLEQAGDVEASLEIYRELTQLQVEIESLEGRLRFLEQTAAFSLINVNLSLAPETMAVDAGSDQTFSMGQAARFRAYFAPPDGIDEFTFTWDFGDGSHPVSGSGSAPTAEPGQRVTATVTHVFEDDSYSPYIVNLKITGKGPAGLVEGSDTMIATVTRIPVIEVFAGEYREVPAGEAAEYTGSFTRPEGLWDLQYRWDFGDGSPVITGTPGAGETQAAATHVYENHRPQPYQATLTITAQSEAGEVQGVGNRVVLVNEAEGLIIGGWSAGNTAKTATRTLSGVVQGAGTLLIWGVIFSPVWLALGAIGYGGRKLLRRLRPARRPAARFSEPPPAATPAGEGSV